MDRTLFLVVIGGVMVYAATIIAILVYAVLHRLPLLGMPPAIVPPPPAAPDRRK